MRKVLDQVLLAWKRLDAPRRAVSVAALVLVPVLVLALTWYAGRPDWEPLPMRLDQRGMASIVQHLASTGTEYRIEGNVILVPRDRKFLVMAGLYEADVDLGENEGWDLLGDMSLSMSSKQLDLIERRILQTEMERTLSVFRFVRDAHVVLTPGEDTVFASERQKKRAKASVTIVRKSSMIFGPAEVQSVVNVVAGGLPGLAREDVSVQDEQGIAYRVGSDGEDDFPATFGNHTANGLELDRELSQQYTLSLQQQLDRIFQPGRTSAQVTVELDHEQSFVQTNRVDPDEVVALSKTETRRDEPLAHEGVVGTASNVSRGANESHVEPRLAQNTDKSQEFRASETHEKRLRLEPRLRLVRAAVVADPRLATHDDATAATPEQLVDLQRNLERIVRNALPIDDTRDGREAVAVVLQRMRDVTPLAEPEAEPSWLALHWRELFEYLLQALLIVGSVLLLFVWWRQARRRLADTRRRIREAHAPRPAPELSPREAAKRRAQEALERHPEVASRVLREWVRQHASAPRAKELVRSAHARH
ncbi:MAG: hypothetical protein H6834_05050 [Planctomycetes bacterium]|nr:hypothetical protein [Planctomycetota bacterium]